LHEVRGVYTIRKATFPDDLEVVRRLFAEYAAGLGHDLHFQHFDEELAALPGKYAAPAGAIWLAEQDGTAADCVALRPRDDAAAEMKRLYVRPSHRGSGIGRALAARAVEFAATRGYRRVVLDTLASMTGAIALYRSLGFAPCAAYYDNPIPGAVYFSRELRGEFDGPIA
jgi:putative acetyltransferase